MVSLSRLTSNLARGTLSFQFIISGFESSRPSQPVTQLKIVGRYIRERPANLGFL
jgi:hypothetical protein